MMLKLGILFAVAVFLETASAASLGVVQTEGGMVEGETISLGLSRSMDIFKGIPFADIPGRFEKPKRHPGWGGVLKATQYRDECLQLNFFQNSYVGSEDCLYLNIWVPHGSSVSSGLPVMVWIYGGGFMIGGSMGPYYLDNYMYYGKEIADRGNVIVVTLGYRVGPMGFMSTGDSDLPGNYGLWDQQAAIAWVHRNIRSFGGDPDNITVFGESAGGVSVSFQVRVFFCLNYPPNYIHTNYCTISGIYIMISDCVHILEPLVLNLEIAPVIDGDFLPDDPSNLFHNAAEIDYIAGVNNMDGHMFTNFDVPSVNLDLVVTPTNDVRRLLAALTKEKGESGLNNAYSTYTSNWGSFPTWDTIKKTIVDIETDYIFLVPTQAALYLHADHATTGRTYSYLFSEPNLLGGPLLPYPSWMGADHADDLQYVFGKPFSSPLVYWPSHRRVSDYLISYWTNFAKTGDPNKGDSAVPATWPTFTRSGEKFLEINSDMNQNYIRQEMRLRYVHFWTSILPSLPTVTSE
uniref:Carboxylic ester hydrolase n=1 Tax=Astatotilapia calliptera TaxID=8154 RepID=A0AAX7TKA4_ASTCA